MLHEKTEQARRALAARPLGPTQPLAKATPADIEAAEAERRRQLAASAEREARSTYDRLWAAAGVPSLYQAADLSDLSRVPADARERYAEAVASMKWIIPEDPPRPRTVALIGGNGPGKTWMACGLVREFCLVGRGAMYRDAMDYFLALQETYDDGAKLTQSKVEGQYLRTALLVLDELGERGNTPWEDRMLVRLINKRYAERRATVLISNQTEPEFVDRLGRSAVDRIADGGGLIVCNWPSLRGRIKP